jgi:hypothetical protein
MKQTLLHWYISPRENDLAHISKQLALLRTLIDRNDSSDIRLQADRFTSCNDQYEFAKHIQLVIKIKVFKATLV